MKAATLTSNQSARSQGCVRSDADRRQSWRNPTRTRLYAVDAEPHH